VTNLGSVWLSFPPSVNNLFSQGIVRGKVRRFPSKSYKRWQAETATRLMAARLKTVTVPVVVQLQLTPRDRRPRDVDNYVKPVLDCLVKAGVLPGDDGRWVRSVQPYWMEPDAKTSGVMVMIEAAAPEKPKLGKQEAKTLEKIRTIGVKCLSPTDTLLVSEQSLVEKGYLELLPGLIPDAPQGLKVAE